MDRSAARVSRAYVVRLIVAYLGLYSAVLSAALVGLALRIGHIDPRHKETSLAVAAALGALVALFANPLAGRLAVPIGMGATAMFAAKPLGFLLPAAAAIACICLFALPLKDVPAPRELPPFSVREFLGTFWTDPRSHPDFGWVWVTRFVTYFASVAPAPYLAYYLTSRTDVSSASVAATVVLLGTLNYTLSAATAAACGWLSDRLGRRKVFVRAAAVLLAAGLAILAVSSTLAVIYVAQALLGIGSGLYFAVDMALATEVLPSSQDTGKDLGVINSADVLPQAIGPAFAPLLLAIGSGHNYTALYLFTIAISLLGILTVTRLKTAG